MPSHSGDLPNPRIKPRSPALWVDSLPSEPPGKPKNTGVGSLSILQGNILIQESNWGLLLFCMVLHRKTYDYAFVKTHRTVIYTVLLLLLSRFSRVQLCATS